MIMGVLFSGPGYTGGTMRTLFSICLLLIASSASSLPADGQDLASFASKAKPIVEAKNPNWKPAGREKLIGKEHKDTFFYGW